MTEEAIASLKGIMNTDLGLEYCGDDNDFYGEMLQDYVDGDKTPDLEKYLAEGDLTNYRVQIHAVKSTSLMIGAEVLSARAKELEMAAMDGNGALVKEMHPSVMADYSALIESIKKALAE